MPIIRIVRALHSYLACALLLITGGLAVADLKPAVPADSLPTLTRVNQIRKLNPLEAKRGYPVRLKAIVTYYGGPGWEVFVQDATGGIYVVIGNGATDIQTGDLVEVTGVTSPGDFAPSVTHPSFRVIGKGSMPTAREVPINSLLTGGSDGQWVEVEGIVHSFQSDLGGVTLNVVSEGNHFAVRLPRVTAGDVQRFIDASIVIQGVCGTIFNEKRQFLGIEIYTPSLSGITVTHPAPDPFSLPVRPLDSILQFSPGQIPGHRIHVQGIVTYQRLGSCVFIQSGQAGLYVLTMQKTRLNPGDRVDVAGFPGRGEDTPVLEDAIFRRIGTGPEPAPLKLTASQAVNGDHDTALVQIDGRLERQGATGGERYLILDNKGTTFEVWFNTHNAGQKWPRFAKGSLLQITGVCSLRVSRNGRPKAISILLRSPKDVVVLERPSWWTVERLLSLAGLLAVLSVVALLGMAELRRRVRAQTAVIHEREEKFEKAFRFSNTGMALIAPDGRFLQANPALCRAIGYSEKELLARSFQDVTHPDDLEVSVAPLRPLLSGETDNYQLQKRYLHKDGHAVWMEVSVSLLRDAQGNPLHFISHFRDITERKAAEDALRASEERFRSLFENSTVGFYRTTPDGRILIANPALVRMLGFASLEELTSRNLETDAVLRNASRGEFRRQVELDGELRGHEDIWRTWDGSLIHIRESARAVRDNEGRVLYYDGVVEDFTIRQRAEEALRESEQRYRLMVERNVAGILRTLQDGTILDCNDPMVKLLGYDSREEFMRRTAEDLYLDPGDRRVLLNLLREKDSLTRQELRFKRKDGKPVWVLLNLGLVEDKTLGTSVVEGSVLDITERKEAEIALLEAKEAAETASRAKSEFLANMSHEIRTPMNGILGMTDLLLDTELQAPQREYVSMVKASADSLMAIINDVLDFSKIEARKLTLESIDFDLRDCVEDTLRSLAVRAHERNLELACRIPPGLPVRVEGDPGRLRQILMNLAGNAIKFTEKGEVIVSVERESESQGSVTLRFDVQDTGVGIPKEKQQIIFEAFTQADSSSTRRFGGTGLGLTIASQLVRLMGGQLWLESEPGKGSVFHCTARFKNASHLPGPEPRNEDLPKGLAALIVDDNAANRRILEETLTHYGVEASSVESGSQALPALIDAREVGKPFAVVLLDSKMPGLDGFGVAKQIRARADLAGLAILMLTSAGQRGDASRCRELGMAGYLTKPVKQFELMEAIRAAVLKNPSKNEERPLITRHSLRESRHSLQVLLVEDNAVNSMLAARLLEKAGHTVVKAVNGREAVEAVERQSYDLVLMDIQMPEMNGLEATAAIRATEEGTGRRIPIIAMTAHAMKGDQERCLAAGMDAYISKPIRAQEFYALIQPFACPPLAPNGEPHAEPDETELFDRAQALERVEGDEELFDEIVRLFLETSPGMLAQLQEALNRGDDAALSKSAHKLKGAISNFGARKAVEEAQALEDMGHAGNLENAPAAFERLVQLLNRLNSALAGMSKQATHP